MNREKTYSYVKECMSRDTSTEEEILVLGKGAVVVH